MFAPKRKISIAIYLSQQSVFPWYEHRERVERNVSYFSSLVYLKLGANHFGEQIERPVHGGVGIEGRPLLLILVPLIIGPVAVIDDLQ